MSQWDKLIEKIYSLSSNVRFDEVYKVLVRCGYTPTFPKSGSSHCTFRKAGCIPITIPKENPVKRAYLEMVCIALDESEV